jgi:hypothetical protein
VLASGSVNITGHPRQWWLATGDALTGVATGCHNFVNVWIEQ